MIIGGEEGDFGGGGDRRGVNEVGIECVGGVGCPVWRKMELGRNYFDFPKKI